MPDTSYTPSARCANASQSMRDGEPSNAPLERVAVDDHTFLRDALLTAIDWEGDFQVRAGGVNNNFTLDVGAISAITLRDAAGTWYYIKAFGGDTVGASKIEGGGGSLGSSAQWWHLYAFLNGSSLDFELSTTAPNASRRLKSTDNTRRFLAAFPTTSAGAPIPLVATRGRYTYRQSAAGSATYVAGDAGSACARPSAGVWTAVSLAGLVPSWARGARLWTFVRRASADASAVLLDLRTPSDAGLVTAAVALYDAAVDTLGAAEVSVVAPAQSVEYALSANVTAADPYGAKIAVTEWWG